ncbi:MAG: hypothetical protein K1X75_15940 [Leptospirales bacterium]|nr:hypothetical protein [Leptospirales bacterium]
MKSESGRTFLNRTASCLIALLSLATACQRVALSAEERQLLIRADELVPYGFPVAVEAKNNEIWTKTELPGGITELKYSYRPQIGPRFFSQIDADIDADGAAAMMSNLPDGIALGMSAAHGKPVRRDSLLPIGDESFVIIDENEDASRPHGFAVAGRFGRTVIAILSSENLIESDGLPAFLRQRMQQSADQIELRRMFLPPP